MKWGDIGGDLLVSILVPVLTRIGLHHTRLVLRETLEWPTKYAQIFANCPLRLRSGWVLFSDNRLTH